jgi:hypothetical protein
VAPNDFGTLLPREIAAVIGGRAPRTDAEREFARLVAARLAELGDRDALAMLSAAEPAARV